LSHENNKTLTGNIWPVFFSYAIPATLGLLAISSAGIIDGMFIGNYVGEKALAAVTLCFPIFPLLMGIAILFSTGGEVFCGKCIGEGKYEKASQIFTKVAIVIFTVSIIMTILGLVFLDTLVYALGADETVYQQARDYLQVIIITAPLITTFSLSYFVRVDGHPKLASTALTVSAILNIILDYIFIVEWEWGIKGGAWGTALSFVGMPILLLPHFFLKRGKIHFVRPQGSLKVLVAIAHNGASAFLSEISGGVLLFIINITMVKFYGIQGVAAYAVVAYLMFFTTMTCYGISDSVKSIISVNFGAREHKRIQQFLTTALITVVGLGIMLITLTQFNSGLLVEIFLKEDADPTVRNLANNFILSISPVLLFIGVNIVLAAWFGAIHQPNPALTISLSRTLIFPILLIPFITSFQGGSGVFTALIVSEVSALILAVGLAIFMRLKNRARGSNGMA